jgi:polyisoprenoid-binding protein YceI
VGVPTQRANPWDIARQTETSQVRLVPRGTWEMDAERSAVGFEVRHLKLLRVRGRFEEPWAVICCDSRGVASITGRIDVASINTGDPRRDARLRAEEFFDVERHPVISYSGVCAPGTRGALAVRGAMTMRGASRPLALRVEPPPATDGNGDGELRLQARGVVSRAEFGLDWDPAFTAGGLVIDDRVAVRLDVALRRPRSS